MRASSYPQDRGTRRTTEKGATRARAKGPAALLGALALAGLPACGDDGGTSVVGTPGAASCQGSNCPFKVGEPAVVASTSFDLTVSDLTLALSSDGETVAAGWSEASGNETIKVATSTDGGETFGAAAQVDAPTDVQLSYPHLLLPDGGGLLVGAIAHFPDPAADTGSPWHSWPRVYRSTTAGTSFKQQSDLKSVSGERSFTQGAFTASVDGKTVGWAWVDTTPPERLDPGAPPAQAVLASISTDAGMTFGAPQVVSTSPFTYASKIAAFVRDGRVAIVYTEARRLDGVPTEVGVAALAMTDAAGRFQPPVLIGADEYGAVPAGDDFATNGAAPGAALGKDGSIHVAWWSAATVGLWYAVSRDGKTFSVPARALVLEKLTPANVKVAVDGSGTAWIAALDVESVRIARVDEGQPPVEVTDAAASLGDTSDTFDIAGLPGGGVAQLWLGGVAGGDSGEHEHGEGGAGGAPAPRPINVRRITR